MIPIPRGSWCRCIGGRRGQRRSRCWSRYDWRRRESRRIRGGSDVGVSVAVGIGVGVSVAVLVGVGVLVASSGTSMVTYTDVPNSAPCLVLIRQ